MDIIQMGLKSIKMENMLYQRISKKFNEFRNI
jgi:hypothetical protein